MSIAKPIVILLALVAAQPGLTQDRFGQHTGASQQQQWQQQPQPPQHGQWQQPPQQGQWQQRPQQSPQQGQWQQPPQPQPRQGQWSQHPQQPGPGQGPAPAGNPIQRLVGMERRDLGVAPQSTLNNGNVGGPTPASIPGGRVITTPEVLQMLKNPRAGALVLDTLGGQQRLPNAVSAVDASAGGSFDDRVQSQFESQLGQLTRGRKDAPIILYCSSINCWMSYNASLRAIHAGYTNVFWYRGGLEAWNYMAQMSQQYGNAQPRGTGW